MNTREKLSLTLTAFISYFVLSLAYYYPVSVRPYIETFYIISFLILALIMVANPNHLMEEYFDNNKEKLTSKFYEQHSIISGSIFLIMLIILNFKMLAILYTLLTVYEYYYRHDYFKNK